jgi:hypothetical protein
LGKKEKKTCKTQRKGKKIWGKIKWKKQEEENLGGKKKKKTCKKKRKRKNKKIYEKSYFLYVCFRVLVNIDVINY